MFLPSWSEQPLPGIDHLPLVSSIAYDPDSMTSTKCSTLKLSHSASFRPKGNNNSPNQHKFSDIKTFSIFAAEI